MELDDPGVWQTRLGDDLAGSGADCDDEVLAAARRLLALTDPAGAEAGKYTVTVNDSAGVQVGDNTVHVENSYGTTAGTVNGPVATTYGQPGRHHLRAASAPPAPPGAQ